MLSQHNALGSRYQPDQRRNLSAFSKICGVVLDTLRTIMITSIMNIHNGLFYEEIMEVTMEPFNRGYLIHFICKSSIESIYPT